MTQLYQPQPQLQLEPPKASSVGSPGSATSTFNTKAQAQCCLVKIKVKKISDGPTTFDGDNQTLINTKGQDFSADTEAMFYANVDNQTFLEEINPTPAIRSLERSCSTSRRRASPIHAAQGRCVWFLRGRDRRRELIQLSRVGAVRAQPGTPGPIQGPGFSAYPMGWPEYEPIFGLMRPDTVPTL